MQLTSLNPQMLLESTFSSTKKFFKNTIKNLRSFLPGGYERLPKTPPFNPFSCSGIEDSKTASSFRELDKFYGDFSNRWDFAGENAMKKRTKNKEKENPKKVDDQEVCEGSCINFEKQSNLETRGQNEKKQRSVDAEKRRAAYKAKEEGSYLVMQRLKELELMDVNNMDHVLDIEEVLHYYSRLTCPAYLEIVDMFFMQMHSEFFNIYINNNISSC